MRKNRRILKSVYRISHTEVHLIRRIIIVHTDFFPEVALIMLSSSDNMADDPFDLAESRGGTLLLLKHRSKMVSGLHYFQFLSVRNTKEPPVSKRLNKQVISSRSSSESTDNYGSSNDLLKCHEVQTMKYPKSDFS